MEGVAATWTVPALQIPAQPFSRDATVRGTGQEDMEDTTQSPINFLLAVFCSHSNIKPCDLTSMSSFGAVLGKQLSDDHLGGRPLQQLQPQETRVPIECLIEYFTLGQWHLGLALLKNAN